MAAEKVTIEALQKHLFSQYDTNVYAVLDGASVPDLELPRLLWKLKPEHVCLYRGELEPDMAEVAPYLVKLEYDHPFTKLVLEKGWGNHWGIFAITDAEVGLREMRTHFRKFLMVINPEGKTIYFRYYDPRVLRVYLPTCNAEEMEMVFGPISCYIVEDEDTAVLVRLLGDDEKVRVEKTKLTQL
jgi:hypothetical protein